MTKDVRITPNFLPGELFIFVLTTFRFHLKMNELGNIWNRTLLLSSPQMSKYTDLFKFDAIDTNPINNYITMPFCAKLAKWLPHCLAPNIITMGSFASALSQYAILAYYDYYFFASASELPASFRVPNWVWLYSAISVSTCIILDALDGMHARNTGTCSVVGELLDHGIDVWRLAAPMLSCVFSLFGRGFFGLNSYEMVHLLLAVQGVMLLTFWQQYLTRTMYYNWAYDIGQYYMIGFYLITYFDVSSTDCWQTYGYFFGSNAHVVEKFLYILLGTISVWQQLSYFICRYKADPINLQNYSIYNPLISYSFLSLTALSWLHLSPNAVSEYDPRAFLWLVTMIFANLMWRLVIDMITKSVPEFTICILNAFAMIVLGLLIIPKIDIFIEMWILRILAVVATLYHLHYVTCTSYTADTPVETAKNVGNNLRITFIAQRAFYKKNNTLLASYGLTWIITEMSRLNIKQDMEFQYDSIDTNPVNNYITMPICYKLAKYIPRWIAPNVITLGSFLSALSHYLVLAYYDYNFFASTYELPVTFRVPNWVWLYSSISILVCITLDALDGKHARNTGSCSPIGELLDHGVDTWRLLAPMLSCVYSLFGRGYFGLDSLEMVHLLLALEFTVALTLWQQYMTKTMYYNWTYDIAQYYLIWFYLSTYLHDGSDYWQCYGYIFGSNAHVIERFLYILLATLSLGQQVSYFIRRCKLNRIDLRNFSIYRPLIAPTIQAIATAFWLHFSPNDISELEPRAFLWLSSIIFTNLMWRLVLNIMTSSTSALTTGFLNIYVLVVSGILLIPSLDMFFELWILRILAISATIYHLHYVVCTIRQISQYYKISIFTVDEKNHNWPAVD